MWLIRYIRSTKITYEQISEFICHDCRKYLIEQEYEIIAKPSTFGRSKPQCNIGTDLSVSRKPITYL